MKASLQPLSLPETKQHIECFLENMDDNLFLKAYLGGAVEGGVMLGETTEDERCLVAVGFAWDGLSL